MRFEERELNSYELVIEAIEAAKGKSKRIEKILMTQAEFDEFYQLAMNNLPASEVSGFLNRKLVFGSQVVIEENNKKKKEK